MNVCWKRFFVSLSLSGLFFSFTPPLLEATENSQCARVVQSLKERGQVSEEAGRHALKTCLKGALKGDAEAQYHVGGLYSSGYLGIDNSHEKTLEWMELSARGGFAAAQWYLGQIYETIYGGEANLENAFGMYLKAAKQGYLPAIMDVGRCYRNGIGTVTSGARAVEWYKKAAKQGLSNAFHELADIYEKGVDDISPDAERSKYWRSRTVQ